MRDKLLKLADILVFSCLGISAIRYYSTNPNILDIINIAALLYVVVRRPDVNTITLVTIILALRIADSLIFADLSGLNNYILHPVLFLFNVVAIGLVWFRPLLASKYGPASTKGHKALAVTHQDIIIGFVFTLQGVWQLLAFLEHVSRHFDDVGLGGVFDVSWWYEHSRLVYNSYPTVQFTFALVGVLILYFMTFDGSKSGVNNKNQGG